MKAGNLRILVFALDGKLAAQRDLPYDADGNMELVAPGEVSRGPARSLVVRLEEAGNTKSGVLLLDSELHPMARFDRFMETMSPVDPSLVFQQGIVLGGPRTYDVVYGDPPRPIQTVTIGWPAGTMSRIIGSRGSVSALCQQDSGDGHVVATDIVRVGVHRVCKVEVMPSDAEGWSAKLGSDEVAELLGILPDRTVVGIVRLGKTEHLMLWRKGAEGERLPWFPAGQSTEFEAADDEFNRYVGLARKQPKSLLSVMRMEPDSNEEARLKIFDRNSATPLVDQPIKPASRIALAPDGTKYSTFQDGALRIYALPPHR